MKKNPHATIQVLYISEKANTDDIWLAPYVGYEVVVIIHPDGQLDYVHNGEVHYDESDKLEYFQQEKP